MTTHKCEQKVVNATAEKPYHFTESGLSNVHLVGIRYFKCECGRKAAEIPALKQLLQLIARDLIRQPIALSGEEIRFLRKRLGKKQADFAAEIGITPETLSRIETEAHELGERNDKLIRLYYAVTSGDSELIQELKIALRQLWTSWVQAKGPKRITASVSGFKWKAKIAG